MGSPEGSEPSGVPAGAPRPSRAPRAGMRGAEGAGTAAPRVPVGFCSPGSPRWRCRGCPRGLPALTVAVEQLQAVVDPVVGLFAVGFLNSKKTREMGKRGERNDKYIAGSFSSAWVPGDPGAGRGSSRQLPLPRAYGGIRETPQLPSGPRGDRGGREAAEAPGTSRCRGPGATERGGPGKGGRVPAGPRVTHLLLLHEAHEGGALDLHGLPLPVVQSQDEVEKVGFPQVGRRLLLEVSPGQTHSAGTTKSRVSGSPDGAASRIPGPLPAPCLPPQGPCGTPMGSPGTEHPSLTPPLRALPSGPGQSGAPERPRRSPAGPGVRHGPDPIPPCGEPRASPPGTPSRHPPTLPGGRGGSQPALHGGERSAPAARCPAERHAPATSQSRLEAVTGAPMCLIFQFQSC